MRSIWGGLVIIGCVLFNFALRETYRLHLKQSAIRMERNHVQAELKLILVNLNGNINPIERLSNVAFIDIIKACFGNTSCFKADRSTSDMHNRI